MLIQLLDNEILLLIIKNCLCKERYELLRNINKEVRILIDINLSLSENYNFCEDCGIYSFLTKKDACDSCHVENHHIQCCYKYTCDKGCLFNCYHCNKINLSNSYSDGWHRIFKCECGNLIRLPDFTWWGSHPKIICNRHCGCGQFDEDYRLNNLLLKEYNDTKILYKE